MIPLAAISRILFASVIETQWLCSRNISKNDVILQLQQYI